MTRYAYMHIHAYTCIYIHTYILTYIHTYTHTYTHTYMHTYIHAYMHTCIHTSMHACMHAYIHTHLTLHCTSLQYITLHFITVHYATLHHIHTCIHRCTHRKSQGRLGRGLPWVAPLAAGTCCASKRVFLVVLFRVFSRARVGTVPVTGCAIWIAYSCKDRHERKFCSGSLAWSSEAGFCTCELPAPSSRTPAQDRGRPMLTVPISIRV